MMLRLFCLLTSVTFAQDDYLDAGRFEDLREVYFDDQGQMHQVRVPQQSTLSPVDLAIIEETNREVREIERDMRILAEISDLLADHVIQDGEKLDVVEQQVEITEQQTLQSVALLTDAAKINSQNMFLSLFLTGGVPLSTGAGVGAAGFFATKATVLAAAPALAATAAPIIIPAAIAVAAGGVALPAAALL